jgi:hypothetical protein
VSQSIRLPRSVRATGAAVGMLVFAGGVGLPAPALASDPLDGASAALNYQCTLPIVGDQPVFANLRSNIPSYWTGSVLSPSFQVQLEARLKGDTFLGMQVVGASPGGSLLGKGKADSPLAGGALLKARFLFPSGAGTTSTLPVSIPLTVPQSPLPEADPGDAGLPLSASGQTPRITLPGPGSAQVFIDSLAMSLQARDATGAPIDGLGDPTDSDGDPSTFDIPCTGNSQKLADITVPAVGTPTGTPVPPTPTPLPPTPTPTPYFGTPTPNVPTPTPTPLPPTPTPTPTPYFGTPTPNVPTPTPTPLPPTPTPTPYFGTPTPNVPTPTPTPLPPTPTPIVGTPVPPTPLPPTPTGLVELPPMHYTVAGKAYLKTLASGSVPMAGTMTVQHLRLSDGSASVPTTFAPTTAKLNALRLLPITASLTFTEVGETRGKLTQNGISFTTNQVIRLKNAKVFGVNLVTSTCVTSAPAVIPLKSPATGFKLSGGGALTGTFTIPSFKSCGVLTSLVTGLAAGSGNGISLTATPAGV